MKNSFLLLSTVSLIWLTACTNTPVEQKNSVTEASATFQNEPNPVNGKAYVDALMAEIDQDQSKELVNYLKIIEVYAKLDRPGSAAQITQRTLFNHPEVENKGGYLGKLSEWYVKLKRPILANAVAGVVKSDYPSLAASLPSLPLNLPALSVHADTLKQQMYDEENFRLDRKLAGEFIDLVEVHSIVAPKDTLSPKMLFEAAETARSLEDYERAINIFDVIYAQYKEYPNAGRALFLKAFTLDNNLEQYEEAGKLYRQFVKEFPNDEFADDTEFLLKNLGKSDEEIIKSFEAKGK